MIGIWKLGENNCPNAVTRVRNSSPKETMTNQCAVPIQRLPLRASRVCAPNSTNRFLVRAQGSPVRPGAGWPIVIVRYMVASTWANRARPTTAMPSEMRIAAICMIGSDSFGGLLCPGQVCADARSLLTSNFFVDLGLNVRSV